MEAVLALAPANVLRTLAGVATDGEAPRLTVHLSGGHVLVGGLVAVGADRGSDVVVLADPETGRLGYALLANVVAVEVLNPELFRDLLSGGRLPLPQAGEPVTQFALRREFAPTREFPVDVDWHALDGSDLALGNLASLLRGLREAVAQVRADEMGKRAWEQVRTLRVEHHAGAVLSVLPVADGLSVRADLSAALPRALAGELFRKISALL